MAEAFAEPDAGSHEAAQQASDAGASASGSADPFLDLYKLAVEMADRVSARRATANGFFLTLNTALLAAVGLVPSAEAGAGRVDPAADPFRPAVLALAGLLLTVIWWVLLRTYGDLNRAKYDIIGKMEARLPAAIFTDEDAILHPKTPPPVHRRYVSLGPIERVVPLVYAIVYAAVLVRALVGMNYLDELAARIRRAVPPDRLPERDTAALFRLYAVLALALGPAVGPEEMHDAWAAWMAASDPAHPALRPFAVLPPDVQRQDAPFVEAIRQVAGELGLGRRG